jgi:predicted TIM-barrel fold metal-dependent hydrolase
MQDSPAMAPEQETVLSKQGFNVMDSDIHVREPQDLWQRLVEPYFLKEAPRYEPAAMGGGRRRMVVAGRLIPPDKYYQTQIQWTEKHESDARYAAAKARNWDSVSLLAAMDAEGVDRAVVFPTRGLYAIATDALAPDVALGIARAYNNWLDDYLGGGRSRLYGAAMAPPHDVDLAAQEVKRAVKALGFKAVFLRPNPVHGRNWHDPYYDPLWAKLEEMDVPACFHEANAPDLPYIGDRFESIFLQHIVCHPLEQMMLMTSLIAGGVLERFKKLRIAFLEGNCSWAQFLIWRMDDHVQRRGKYLAPYLKRKPSEYFQDGRCFISIDCDEEPARYTIDMLGDNALLFSTDYPHSDSRYPKAVEAFLKMRLPETTKRKVLWENCRRLYQIK